MIFPAPARRLSTLFFGRQVGLGDLEETARRRIRAAQIGAVVELVPLTMSVNLLNGLIIVFVFWDKSSPAFLLPWGMVLLSVAAASFWSWSRTRRKKPQEASARAIRRVAVHATMLGAIWGIMPVVLFGGADLQEQFVLACLVAGMISAGAFCLSTVSAASLGYTWTLVACSVIGLLSADRKIFVPVAILLMLYAVFISRNAVTHGNLFKSYLRDKLKVQSQSELIALLLNDFQEHASDWLWETNADDILVRVSERFAEASGKNAAVMQGSPLADSIGAQYDYQPHELSEIRNQMKRRLAFRDIVLPVRIGGEQRYWLMSAKPVFDHAGKFTGYHGVGADITEKRQSEERITHLAYSDPVTGLPNRVSFSEKAGAALADARLHDQCGALLCLDLDQFKSVNDTLGHPVGDELLKSVGKRLRACARDRDIVARIGGDEFAILQIAPHLPVDAMMLARQIIDAFKTPFKLGHGELAISTSIGIAVAPDDGWDVDNLLKKADLGLYAAKANGSGTFRFFEREMETGAQRRRALEDGLRAALDNGEFEVAYQPLVDLGSWSIAGCEALARWKSPQWGYVSPAEFIPVAEASGLIDEIGEWILRAAVREARNWPEHTVVAVNLSPVQFKNQKLLATVVSALAESGLPPRRLELEVTESIFLDGAGQTLTMLENLRSLGVRTSLDDFGTGYSSLSYLRRFPFDKIKIDKSFIDDVGAHDHSLAIIRAIVALANALGMSTTAEGVESVAQVDKLRDAGCTQIQGYVFSKPVPAAEIAAMMTAKTCMPLVANGAGTQALNRAG